MVTFLSLAVLRLVGVARAEDDVVAAIDARADEFAEAAGGIGIKGMMVAAKVLALTAVGLFLQPELMERRGGGFCICAFVGGSGAAVGLSQVESAPGVVFGSACSLILGTHLVFLRGLSQISLSGEI